MSANNKFWANVTMLKTPQLQLYLSHREKDAFERAVHSASTSNVLTGIDYKAMKLVEDLLNQALLRRAESEKSYSGAFRRGMV